MWCEKVQASHGGWTKLQTPLTWTFYENWLKAGHSGEMTYLQDHAESKKNPQKWKPDLKSALVFAFPYVEHPFPKPTFDQTRIALYAQGFDYHFWIQEKLQQIIQELKSEFPQEVFETHTDSSPILERDLSYRAGLGWFGKNTCLIHPKKGSLFLIGEILTSLDVRVKTEALPDFCGTCQRCMDICPTQALTSPRTLEAPKCISYLTIESKKVPPLELREKMGDWFFGCDLCQTVCPWNQKVFKNKLVISSQLELKTTEKEQLESELKWILTSSHHQILKKVKGTPLYRAGAKGLKRNALIVIANQKLIGLKSEVESLVEDSFLGELATWALQKLDSSEGLSR